MNVQRVTPQEAFRLTQDEGYTYVDVRTEREWQGGHAPGSKNVPFAIIGPMGMMPNTEFVEVCARVFGKEERLVLGCKTGSRSYHATTTLMQAGFSNVVDMAGGMAGEMSPYGGPGVAGWLREGLPVTSDCPATDTYRHLSGGE